MLKVLVARSKKKIQIPTSPTLELLAVCYRLTGGCSDAWIDSCALARSQHDMTTSRAHQGPIRSGCCGLNVILTRARMRYALWDSCWSIEGWMQGTDADAMLWVWS